MPSLDEGGIKAIIATINLLNRGKEWERVATQVGKAYDVGAYEPRDKEAEEEADLFETDGFGGVNTCNQN